MRTFRIARRGIAAALLLSAAGATSFACILGSFEVVESKADPDAAITEAGTTDTGGQVDTGVDAPADAGIDGPKTYCDTAVAPPGSTQFFCADFDGDEVGKNWDAINRSDGGHVLEKTEVVAFSEPSSLAASASGANGNGGTLAWNRQGAKVFIEASARARMNPTQLAGVVPPATGLVQLLDIRTTNAAVSFGYSRGASVESANYFGYYVQTSAFGGAAAIANHELPLAAQLQVNVWTDVKLVYLASGEVNLFFNDLRVFSTNDFGSNDTRLGITIGAAAKGNVGAQPVWRFDNVELNIRRAP